LSFSTRRTFLAYAGAAVLAPSARSQKRAPVGLMAYAMRQELENDMAAALKAIAKMGYDGIEFWAPYFFWTPAYAKEVRARMDDLNIKCLSTHNESLAFSPDGLSQAIDLNKILGSQSIVAARGLVSAVNPNHGFEGMGLDGWKRLAATFQRTAERVRAVNMTCGFHNHTVEFQPIEGKRPIDVLAGVTELVFHLDVSPCRQAEVDPVAFMEQYPGRTHSVLCSDWPANRNKHQPLLGDGKENWKQLFAKAESVGGLRFYLIQQETSDLPMTEAVQKDLERFRALHP